MIDRTEFDMRLVAHHRRTAQVENHGWEREETRSRVAYRLRLSRTLLRAALWLAPPASPAESGDIAWAIKERR